LSQFICNKSDKQELVHVQDAIAGVGGEEGKKGENLFWHEVSILCMQEIPLIMKCTKRRNVYVNNVYKFWY